ncbi:hypothetical protein A9W95_02800 [Mycobacterium sp. 1423905.2]|nr:hypothetical protein A9W95_02800 [Mycobacterium sp. 1423905.2]
MAVALLVAAAGSGACTTWVPGRPVRAAGQVPMSARELLLHDGDDTPLGPAHVVPVGDNYFTSVQPPICAAALLFKNSPLRPPAARDSAEAAYTFGGPAQYAESIDVYDQDLDAHQVVWRAFSDVSDCRDDAVGVSPSGSSQPMRVTEFDAPQDNVFHWAMGRPDWTCTYGLAAVTRAVLLISVCDAQPGFPMADWAAKRRAQLDRHTA